MPIVFVVCIPIVTLPHVPTTSCLRRSRLSASIKLGSRSCICSCRKPTLFELLQQMSSHGSEKGRASEDLGRSSSWGADRRGEYRTRLRREASAGSERTGDWQWVRQPEAQWSASGGATDRSDHSTPWTLWERVQDKRTRQEGDAMSVRSDSKQSWGNRGYRPVEPARAEQDCPPREWERYPQVDPAPACEQAPTYTQEEKRAGAPWQSWTAATHSWAPASWSWHESGAKSDYGPYWKQERAWSESGS